MKKLGYALYMGAMGFAGGFGVNYLLLADGAELWSQTYGLICAAGAALLGFIGGLVAYDESF
jgi:hypothetical protein